MKLIFATHNENKVHEIKNLIPKKIKLFSLHDIGFEIILGNAFHLFQRPGLETIKKFNGLHKFMGWNKSILTDEI